MVAWLFRKNTKKVRGQANQATPLTARPAVPCIFIFFFVFVSLSLFVFLMAVRNLFVSAILLIGFSCRSAPSTSKARKQSTKKAKIAKGRPGRTIREFLGLTSFN
jgi:hypothetical protein